MVPGHRTAIFLLSALLCLVLSVRAENPTHAITHFHNLPTKLFFFEDSTSAIYHDYMEGSVYVSSDEGKSWNRVSDIPSGEAVMVIQHPFDNRYAFVLSGGKTHWRSEDRGKTWRPFEMPIAPALVPRPLSFHSDKAKYGYILYQGTTCDFGVCRDETYYTKEAFGDTPSLLFMETSRCQFAHSSADFRHEAHSDLIYCVGFDTSSFDGGHTISSSRLFSSTDFFTENLMIEDLGIGKNAKGVVAFAIVSKFAVVALRDLAPGNNGEMLLYVTEDTKVWAKAQFPHASSARLRENAYTIVESTTHSLAVDVKLQDMSTIGTLFVSNSNGTFFVQSLKDTNRNEMGFVDYENLYGVDGVGLANVVANAADVEGRGADKQLRTVITFDDGSSWASITPPATDSEGKPIQCKPTDVENCALHFHSVTTPHNLGRVFSSPAPGFVMGVGTIGATLGRYTDSATFLSTNAGVDWKMLSPEAHKYEFGDQGSILVMINDEESVSDLRYSTNLGKTWISYDFGINIRARALTTIPDSTSQKFILLGQLHRREATEEGRFVVVFLDFAPTRPRKCGEADFENWYARTANGKECLMGHKQWYKRRKIDADCYVGEKFQDPVEHEENCPCDDDDFECDYNFVRSGNDCVPVGPERIPAGVCTGAPDQMYQGSSGWRKIPGNTCVGGLTKDAKVDKKCSQAQPAEGEVIHQTFEFPAQIVQHAYFKDSSTILVRLADLSMWQSSNEGYTWKRLFPEEQFWAFYHHTYTNDRAYLITNKKKFYYTTDTGRAWNSLDVPTMPNTFQTPVLQFHPNSDYLIWTGDSGCEGQAESCHAESHYSRDNGRHWTLVDTYVQKCAWAKDAELTVDPAQILCESYRDKVGSQKKFRMSNNALQLVGGTNYFSTKTKLFDHVVGFTKFSEFLIVAEYLPSRGALDLQVSMDGRTFATGRFPPNMHPDAHAYTILESTTDAIFLHVTMSEPPSPYWGNLLKSNSNGTYFGLSLENVNRDERGLVDFEKMIGLDGIAVVNIVTNPQEARVTNMKMIQTRITHNDGSTWKPLVPPTYDSMGQRYDCDQARCSLNIHGYTERPDPRATYSSPSVVGLMLAVGNVGEFLEPYTESDTFLSRDAGFTWEEVHKDAHLWEFGDSGSILIMANDEEPTDHVLFSTDEGLTWREYKFGDKMRVRTIVTVSSDTSRRFILMGNYPRSSASVVVHLDFSALTSKQCRLNLDDPENNDFELWSPSEERAELCLFGRQTQYPRRIRNATCVVGDRSKVEARFIKNCVCAQVDFECEFNYVKNENDECVLVPETTPLPNDNSCRDGAKVWYERTAYRKIPYSTCEEGPRPDRGAEHVCPGFYARSTLFWLAIILLPFAFTALIAFWYYRRGGMARGAIRLPGDARSSYGRGSGVVDYLASVPWFIVGIAGVAWEAVSSFFESMNIDYQARGGYRDLPIDEDAQILRFEDEAEEE